MFGCWPWEDPTGRRGRIRRARAEKDREVERGKERGGQAAGSDIYAADWEGRTMPRFAPPPKPPRNEGLDALQRLAAAPAKLPERLLMQTRHVLVAYDLYPKARVHVLLLPRNPTLHHPSVLT